MGPKWGPGSEPYLGLYLAILDVLLMYSAKYRARQGLRIGPF